MANPSGPAIAAIQARVAAVSAWSRSDALVLADLQANTQNNPAPRANVPAGFGRAEAGALIGTASLAKLFGLPSFSTLIGMLDLPDPKPQAIVARLNGDLASLAKAGALTQTEFDSLAAPTPGTTAGAPIGLVNRTVPDPAWPATVPVIQVQLGRPVDVEDIHAARVAGGF